MKGNNENKDLEITTDNNITEIDVENKDKVEEIKEKDVETTDFNNAEEKAEKSEESYTKVVNKEERGLEEIKEDVQKDNTEDINKVDKENIEKGTKSAVTKKYCRTDGFLIIAAIAAIVVSLVILIVEKVTTQDTGSEILSSGVEEVKLTKDLQQELTDRLLYLQDNGYVKHMVSETDFFTILYNSKGEAILNSVGGITLYTKDNEVIIPSADGTFTTTTELTPIGYIQLCIDGVADGLGTITKETVTNKVVESEDSENTAEKVVTKYTLTVKGNENVSKLYGKVSQDFNTEAMADYEEQGIEVGIVMELYLDDEAGLGGIYKISLDDVDYTVWIFDGYTKVGNWELNEKIYKDEITADEYDSIFQEAVAIANAKISFNDLIYLYINDDTAKTEVLDKVYTKDEYLALTEDDQYNILSKYVEIISGFSFKYHLGDDLNTLNYEVKEYYKNVGNKDNLILFDFISYVATEKNLVTFDTESLGIEHSEDDGHNHDDDVVETHSVAE